MNQVLEKFIRAADYLSAVQIYLRGNYLLNEPLKREHIKPRLLGHWGTCPGVNFTYAHLNRAIIEHDLDMMFVLGPGQIGAAKARAYQAATAWALGHLPGC